jgi:hypothetical protein
VAIGRAGPGGAGGALLFLCHTVVGDIFTFI